MSSQIPMQLFRCRLCNKKYRRPVDLSGLFSGDFDPTCCDKCNAEAKENSRIIAEEDAP